MKTKTKLLTANNKKQIDAYKFKQLLKKLTVAKTENAHLLKITPEFYNLVKITESNSRATTKPYIKHQQNILNSVEECGIISAVALVIKNNELHVAEGANRVTAWKSKNITFFAFVSKGSFSDTFTNSNMYVKPLKNQELVEHCKVDGNNTTHYRLLDSVTNEHKEIAKHSRKLNKLQSCLIWGLLAGTDRNTAKKLVQTKKFKTSTVFIRQTKKITKQVYELQSVGLSTGIRVNEGVIKLILEKGENYKHTKFIEIIKKTNLEGIVSSNNAKTITNRLRDLHDGTYNGLPRRK